MSSPRTVPSRGAKDVVTFTVRVDGADLPKTLEISGISVFKAIGRIPFARIEILDGDPAAQSFPASESDLFTPGKEVKILAGYRSEEDAIFTGILVGQKIRIRQSGRGLLTLHCRHPLYRATLTRRCRTWQEVSDADAISSSFGEYGVDIAAASGGIVHPALFQYESTDWDFALVRARASGLFLIPTDAGVDLAKPDFAQEPALSLQFGATVFELDAEFDIRDQPASVRASAWDPAAQEIVETTGEEPTLPAAGNFAPADMAAIHSQDVAIRHPGAVSEEELQAFATAALLVRRLGAIVGRAQCTGTPAPLPGAILKLEGAGARFSGDLLISAVRHTLAAGSWTTDVQFGIPSSPEPPFQEMVPRTRGLQIGVVEALEGDPDGEFRIRVRLPVLGNSAGPVFARLASFDAGPDRGGTYFPEIGDEVVVAFLDADPRHAIVLGSLHSSARAAPVEPADANPEKGYYSRSGVKLVFNDEKKSLRLETPAGNFLTLDEDAGEIRIVDQHGNKVVLDAAGISLESAKDLILKAAATLSIGGVNISADASGSFTATGSAGAELSASGNTVIKGALVQIN
ncbi:MAG: type VI secretion system tip protein VgrG [Verrucomicrobiota bacterium]